MKNVFDVLYERGLVDAVTSDELRTFLDKPIKVYSGFDPTADSLHLGNLVPIVILRWFQKFGHSPFVILGGATGRIGDPSGKSSERPLLDTTAITLNVRRIRAHFEQVLDFFHASARPLVLNNDSWWEKMNAVDFLRDVGRHFRVNMMLNRESVRSRMEAEEGLSFTEFSYQLLQAYDFYYLNQEHGVSLQIGGSDQWGNILGGIDLTRRLSGKAVFGLTFPLLTRSDGKKFGKSESGAIWLAADRCSPYEMYQYLYRVADTDVIKMLRMLTFLDMEEIRAIEADMQKPGVAPNTAQKRLAEEITRMLHDEAGLTAALQATAAAAPGHKAILDVAAFERISNDLPNISFARAEVVGAKITEIVWKSGLASSKSEAARLIQQGGAYLNNAKIMDGHSVIGDADLIGGRFMLLAAGKKNKVLLRIS